MIKALLDRYPGDIGASFMIGDKPSDLAAARASGIAGYLFDGSNLHALIAPLLTDQSSDRLRRPSDRAEAED